MLTLSSSALITALQDLPPEMVGLLSFGVCAATLLGALARFGVLGLAVYNVVAVLAANVQVLKTGQFMLLGAPVALGTVVSASCFLAVDLATEHYGLGVAKRIISLSFAASVVWLLLMLLVLGIKPTDSGSLVHEAMSTLFTPTPAIVLASLCAYVASQQLEIRLFQRIKDHTGTKALWLRSSISMYLSAFCDTVIFSVLAWVVFAPSPVDFNTLIWTYILGTFMFRMVAMFGNVGVMYLARLFKKKKRDEQPLSAFSV